MGFLQVLAGPQRVVLKGPLQPERGNSSISPGTGLSPKPIPASDP